MVLTFIPYLFGWLGTECLVVISMKNAVLALLVVNLVRDRSIEQGRITIRQMYLLATIMVLAFVIIRVLVS